MAEAEKTVYILGAGFSRAFSEMTGTKPEFPVMSDFMVHVNNDMFWESSFPADEKKALVEWIDTHYIDRNGINVEDLMTVFELMKEGYLESMNYDEFESQRILADKLLHALKNYIRSRLRLYQNLPDFLKEKYMTWIKSSKAKSIFVSFNYDSLFEDLGGIVFSNNFYYVSEMNSFLLKDTIGWHDKFEFTDFKNPPMFLYKLHGSLEWYCCSNINCNQNVKIFSDYAPLSFKEGKPIKEGNKHIPRTFCPICGNNMEFVFIPPQIVKDINKFPKIKLMWRHVAQAIKLCTNIVIIGYSFPLTDARTTYMMMRSLEGREKKVEWTIVDIKPKKIQKRLIEILPKHKNIINKATAFTGRNALLDYLTDFAEKNPAD